MDNSSASIMDKNLIIELQESPTRDYKEIGKKLGVSQSTVRRHVKKLTDSNMIKFIAVPNPRKTGPSHWAEFGLKITPNLTEEVARIVSDIPGVYMVGTCLGRYDLLISARFESITRMYEFVDTDIKKIEGVIDVESLLISRLVKYYSFK